MNGTWIALVDDDQPPEGAFATARVREGGSLAAWNDEGAAPEGAWRVDPRTIDPEGRATLVGLATAPSGVSYSFDDPAVVGAIRALLGSEPPTLVTTLAVSGGRFAGALVSPPHLATPFGTIFPLRAVHVGAGLLGRPPAPTGPVTQRYRAEIPPWPFDRFS